jgi:hypothetical protein
MKNDWPFLLFLLVIIVVFGTMVLVAPHIPEPEPAPPSFYEVPALLQSRTTTVHVTLSMDLENLLRMYSAENDEWRILIDGEILEATAAGETGGEKPGWQDHQASDRVLQ